MASDYDSWMVNTLCDELSVKKLKCSIDDLESLQKLLDKIINARDKSINILSEAIESLSKHHRNVKVARVSFIPIVFSLTSRQSCFASLHACMSL